MTGPANSTTRGDGSRTYAWNGETFPSVTTILRAEPKPALMYWSARKAAERAIEMTRSGELADALHAGQEREMIDVLRNACWDHRDDAADTGSAVHHAIERAILHGDQPDYVPPMSDAARPRFQAFREFEARYRPTWEASEATVYNRPHGYAGTLDAIAVIGGRRFILDVKTGKDVYPNHALQLAAYARGEFIGIASPGGGFGAQEHPMPKVDSAAVLLLRPRSWRLVEVDITAPVFDAFLVCMQMADWTTRVSRTAVRGTVPVPDEDASDVFRRFGGGAA